MGVDLCGYQLYPVTTVTRHQGRGSEPVQEQKYVSVRGPQKNPLFENISHLCTRVS